VCDGASEVTKAAEVKMFRLLERSHVTWCVRAPSEVIETLTRTSLIE